MIAGGGTAGGCCCGMGGAGGSSGGATGIGVVSIDVIFGKESDEDGCNKLVVNKCDRRCRHHGHKHKATEALFYCGG